MYANNAGNNIGNGWDNARIVKRGIRWWSR